MPGCLLAFSFALIASCTDCFFCLNCRKAASPGRALEQRPALAALEHRWVAASAAAFDAVAQAEL